MSTILKSRTTILLLLLGFMGCSDQLPVRVATLNGPMEYVRPFRGKWYGFTSRSLSLFVDPSTQPAEIHLRVLPGTQLIRAEAKSDGLHAWLSRHEEEFEFVYRFEDSDLIWVGPPEREKPIGCGGEFLVRNLSAREKATILAKRVRDTCDTVKSSTEDWLVDTF